MKVLYEHFQLAPELGSLLDPTTVKADAFTASFEQLQPVLKKALENEANTEQIERGVMAAGIAKAGLLLSKKYTFQITNVPYLSRGKQDKVLASYCEKNFPEAKGDLATVFLDKMLKSNSIGGVSCSVIPQNWLFLTSYKKFREKLIENESWSIVARLGAKSFQTPMWDFNVMLISIRHIKPPDNQIFFGCDVSDASNAVAKEIALKTTKLTTVDQKQQLNNPDVRVIIGNNISGSLLLSNYANCYQGISPADFPMFGRNFWEIERLNQDWWFWQSTVKETTYFGGKELIIWIRELNRKVKEEGTAYIRGSEGWGKDGISVSAMNTLPVTISKGQANDTNAATIIPKNKDLLPAIWCFCSSTSYNEEVRKIDQTLKVTNASLVKIPFDLDFWQKIASERYSNGLPEPYSDDPTQWLFHGHPLKTDNTIQVSIVRILGYRWPTEGDPKMELADEAKSLIQEIKAFDHLTDDDGIFCIPSVNAEEAGAERLRNYLQEVFAKQWGNQTITQLLAKEGAISSNLEDWLRKEFFIQHCKVFQNRPFIWHIWDGRSDGFSALVNYHKLDKDNLSKLIYTYLGDWIRNCEAKKRAGESGAEGLLIAAVKLKEKLEAILQGEAPYDIFVRWKPSEQQPIGWDPDLNDGVRLNIRPFVEADVLRKKPNIKWGIDRGKNPPGSPWGEIRDNDKHLTLEEKKIARENSNINQGLYE